jgi:toxin ParE1/3/4
MGKHRIDISEGYYSFPEGQHVVFYLIGSNSIDIIGIPHKAMDTISYFHEG